MNRVLAVAALLMAVRPAVAEDREFLRALENAQRARPSQLSSTSRIAPETEPGTALVVHGRAFAADGCTPLADAIVFAYHTDRDGAYDRRGAPAHSWRLKGWAKTGDDGRFEFRTIRPGPYPGRKIAAHIHLTLFTADGDALALAVHSSLPLARLTSCTPAEVPTHSTLAAASAERWSTSACCTASCCCRSSSVRVFVSTWPTASLAASCWRAAGFRTTPSAGSGCFRTRLPANQNQS